MLPEQLPTTPETVADFVAYPLYRGIFLDSAEGGEGYLALGRHSLPDMAGAIADFIADRDDAPSPVVDDTTHAEAKLVHEHDDVYAVEMTLYDGEPGAFPITWVPGSP